MTSKPREGSTPRSPRRGTMDDQDLPVFKPIPEDKGYSVEDAYRLLAGLPLTPVETTPVE